MFAYQDMNNVTSYLAMASSGLSEERTRGYVSTMATTVSVSQHHTDSDVTRMNRWSSGGGGGDILFVAKQPYTSNGAMAEKHYNDYRVNAHLYSKYFDAQKSGSENVAMTHNNVTSPSPYLEHSFQSENSSTKQDSPGTNQIFFPSQTTELPAKPTEDNRGIFKTQLTYGENSFDNIFTPGGNPWKQEYPWSPLFRGQHESFLVFPQKSYMQKNFKCGDKCSFGPKSFFESYCNFGDNCQFGYDCTFGPNCTFGSGCRFACSSKFEERCLFGKNCIFHSGCMFGKNCVLGEFSVVNKLCRFDNDCLIPDTCTLQQGVQIAGFSTHQRAWTD